MSNVYTLNKVESTKELAHTIIRVSNDVLNELIAINQRNPFRQSSFEQEVIGNATRTSNVYSSCLVKISGKCCRIN